ncbi:MAG: hypothetical protein B6244_01315 [Candidatus Cloacimonetes bacterium 4572_55]|nr:MAG: hypothetical protein B6244_01315 [Candidatus Cloacimonetes bacterium 4572_55]
MNAIELLLKMKSTIRLVIFFAWFLSQLQGAAASDYEFDTINHLYHNELFPPYCAQNWSNIDESFFIESPYGLLIAGKTAFSDQQNYDLARFLLRQSILRYPDSEMADETWYWLGRSYYATDAYGDAAEAFKQCSHLTLDERFLFFGQYWAGKSHFAMGEHAKALAQFEASMRLNLASEDAMSLLFWIARTYFRLGMYQEASSMFESKMLRSVRQQIAPYFYYFSIQSFLGLGEYDKVVRDGNYFLSHFSEHFLTPEIHYDIAFAYFQQAQLDSALLHARSCLTAYPYCSDSTGDLVWRSADESAISVAEEIRFWWADDVYFLYGWIHYLQDELAVTDIYFDKFPEYFPTSPWHSPALFYRGVISYDQGNYEEALLNMSKFIRGFPRDPLTKHAFYRKAWALYHLDRIEEASETLEIIKNRYSQKNSDFYQEAIFVSGEMYYYQDKLEETLAVYQLIIDQFGQSEFYADALYGAAWCYYRDKKFDRALDYFAQFTDISPPNRLSDIACYRSGLALFKLREYEKSIESFKAFLSHTVDAPFANQAQFYIGEAYFELEKYEAAIDNYKSVLTNYPKSRSCPQALFGIGNAYFNRKQYHQAIKYLEKLESYNNAILLQEGWYLIERALHGLGVYKNSLDVLINYIRKHPESDKTQKLQKELAYYHFHNRDYGKAIKEFQAIIVKYPKSALQQESEYMVGRCYFHLKDFSAARFRLKQALNNEKHRFFHGWARYYLGRSYAIEKDEKTAFVHYETVISDYPESEAAPFALLEIAEHYIDLRRWDEALLNLNRVIDKYGNTQLICEARSKMIEVLIEHGNVEALKKQFSALSRASCPDEYMLEASVTLANYYFDNFYYEEAEKLFENIYMEYSRSEKWRCEALYKAARCAVALKKYSIARERIDRVLESDCEKLLQEKAERLKEIISSNE